MTEKMGPFEIQWLTHPMDRSRPLTPSDDVLMAKTLMSNLHTAKMNEVLHVYENGVFRPVGDDIYTCCMDIYDRWGLQWGTRKDNQVYDYIFKKAPILRDRPDPNIVNMKNGVYIISEERFEPHENEFEHWKYLSTTQIPIVYDEKAECDEVTRFMEEVFPGGSDLLFDVIGTCLSAGTNQHKAIVLLGEGSNGKSIFLYGLRSCVGEQNVSATTIHSLCDPNNRFANNDLVSKLVNASDDTPQGEIADVSNFKSIVSGNPIRVEGKFKQAITYKPFCKLIFGSNHRLQTQDETSGYKRRLFHVPFQQSFDQNPEKEKDLQKMFDDPTNRSGIFNEIRKRIKITSEFGFQIPDRVRDIVETFDPMPDRAKKWIEENVKEDLSGRIRVDHFRVTYCVDIKRSEPEERVTRYLLAMFPGIQIKRPRYSNGRQHRTFMGIAWKNERVIEITRHIMSDEASDRAERERLEAENPYLIA